MLVANPGLRPEFSGRKRRSVRGQGVPQRHIFLHGTPCCGVCGPKLQRRAGDASRAVAPSRQRHDHTDHRGERLDTQAQLRRVHERVQQDGMPVRVHQGECSRDLGKTGLV